MSEGDALLALLGGARAPAGASWGAIAALAETEGVAPLVHAALRDAGPAAGDVPAEVRARLRRAYERAWARNAVMLARYDEVVGVLARPGIRALALKGIALVDTVYHDPGLRPMADVDVLVPEADFARAQAALGAGGWHAADGPDRAANAARGFALLTRERTVLDLHRDLAGYPRVAAVVRVDHAGLWRRAHPLPRGGWQLSSEDQLLHLAHHLVLGSEFGRVLNFVDVDRLVRGTTIDWDRALGEAARWRISGVLGYVLHVVAGALATPVPAAVLTRLAPAGLRRLAGRLVDDACPPTLRGPRSMPRAYLAETLLMDRPRWMLRVATTTLFPPAPWLRSHYGIQAPWEVGVARARHPLRVAALAARAVIGRAR